MSMVAINQRVEIELLYLDLDTCDRCRGADRNLDAALEATTDVLALAGHEVTVRKTQVTSEEQAAALGFASSPTIRVNGHDISLAVDESRCSACSRIAATDVGCRTWSWKGEQHSSPPTGMIVDAILRGVYGHDTAAAPTLGEGESVGRFLAATHDRSG